MRTTADFIMSQPRLQFAGYFRGTTASAVSMPVPVGLMEREPKMSADAYEALLVSNRERTSPRPSASPDETIHGPGFTTRRERGFSKSDEPLKSHEFRPGGEGEDPTKAAEEW